MTVLSLLRNSQAIRRLATCPPSGKQNTSVDPKTTFRSQDLVIKRIPPHELKSKDWSKKIQFGHEFSDYMLEVNWTAKSGWETPVLHKTKDVALHPAAKGLHYGVQLFEGLKAFRGIDNKVRLFRPELNMQRMNRTAIRCALPTFDEEEFISLLSTHIAMDKDWIPAQEGAALYIRPFMFGSDGTLGVSPSMSAKLMVICSPVASYFGNTSNGLQLLADPRYVRAWPGGAGAFKMGSNYAPTVSIAESAAKKQCHQVLWLSGDEQWVTEAGTMNFAMIWINESGERELITPALDKGLVLPGVTRQSILELAQIWEEFKVSEKDFTLDQMLRGIREKRVQELFGCGTAAVVAPVTSLLTVGKNGEEKMYQVPAAKEESSIVNRIYREITDIQYGRKEMKDWVRVVS